MPLAANDLHFPGILGLRVPRPVLLECTGRIRSPPSPARTAGRIVRDICRTAGVPERCRVSSSDAGYPFDGPMQDEAFAWFECWLA